MQVTLPTPPILVKPIDAARMVTISERKLWELTNRGEIPCVRIGRSVRYLPADLQEWALSHRQGGAS